jgi:hypothetical protein
MTARIEATMTWNKGIPPQELAPIYLVKFSDWQCPSLMKWESFHDENGIDTLYLCFIDADGDSYRVEEIPKDVIWMKVPNWHE